MDVQGKDENHMELYEKLDEILKKKLNIPLVQDNANVENDFVKEKQNPLTKNIKMEIETEIVENVNKPVKSPKNEKGKG